MAGESSLNGVRGRKIPRFRATGRQMQTKYLRREEKRGRFAGDLTGLEAPFPRLTTMIPRAFPVATSLEAQRELNRGGGGGEGKWRKEAPTVVVVVVVCLRLQNFGRGIRLSSTVRLGYRYLLLTLHA